MSSLGVRVGELLCQTSSSDNSISTRTRSKSIINLVGSLFVLEFSTSNLKKKVWERWITFVFTWLLEPLFPWIPTEITTSIPWNINFHVRLDFVLCGHHHHSHHSHHICIEYFNNISSQWRHLTVHSREQRWFQIFFPKIFSPNSRQLYPDKMYWWPFTSRCLHFNQVM